MAYTVNKSNGAVLTTIADGTIDTTTGLTLVGKNYSGYGEILNENLVKLLEHFASSSQPTSPLSGQLWWDLTNGLLKVYTGSAFKVISGSTASASQPTGSTTGDLWWDTTNSQLKVYNGSSYTLIGPSFTAGTGTSGALVDTVTDSLGSSHVVVKFFVNESLVAVLSKDTTFTPQSAIGGFATIAPGLQLSTAVSGATFKGTASNADLLDSLNSTQFIRSDANATTTGTLGVTNDTGFTVGADNDIRLSVTGTDAYISNQTSDGDIFIRVLKSVGGVTSAITIDGATAAVTMASTPSASDNSLKVATTAYVDTNTLYRNGTNSITGTILPNANITHNLGSASFRFNSIYCSTLNGTSLAALYADLAERFAADDIYEPGTVVALGGPEEITAVAEELSDSVFGVISSRAAYLMNSGAGDDATHPAVAMTGRVPVKVTGTVNKGDRLVAAGNGVARAAGPGEATSFNTIGRALEIKETAGVGTILAVVTIN